jgi:hypothetical protein
MPLYANRLPQPLLDLHGPKAPHLFKGSPALRSLSRINSLGADLTKAVDPQNAPFVIIPSREALHVFDCTHLSWVMSEPTLGYKHLADKTS